LNNLEGLTCSKNDGSHLAQNEMITCNSNNINNSQYNNNNELEQNYESKYGEISNIDQMINDNTNSESNTINRFNDASVLKCSSEVENDISDTKSLNKIKTEQTNDVERNINNKENHEQKLEVEEKESKEQESAKLPETLLNEALKTVIINKNEKMDEESTQSNMAKIVKQEPNALTAQHQLKNDKPSLSSSLSQESTQSDLNESVNDNSYVDKFNKVTSTTAINSKNMDNTSNEIDSKSNSSIVSS